MVPRSVHSDYQITEVVQAVMALLPSHLGLSNTTLLFSAHKPTEDEPPPIAQMNIVSVSNLT